MEVFRAQGAGHLVLISSVACVRGMPQTRTAYGASKAAVNALAEGIRSDVWGTGIAVSTILPGYIATDINVGRRGPFTVDLDTGVDALTAAIEQRAGAGLRARVAVDADRPAAPGAPALGRPPPHLETRSFPRGNVPRDGAVTSRSASGGRGRRSLPSPTHSPRPSASRRRRPGGGAGVQRVDHRDSRRRLEQGLLDVHDPAQRAQPLRQCRAR